MRPSVEEDGPSSELKAVCIHTHTHTQTHRVTFMFCQKEAELLAQSVFCIPGKDFTAYVVQPRLRCES